MMPAILDSRIRPAISILPDGHGTSLDRAVMAHAVAEFSTRSRRVATEKSVNTALFEGMYRISIWIDGNTGVSSSWFRQKAMSCGHSGESLCSLCTLHSLHTLWS